MNCLVDLITLAHLHQGRALPNTKTNVIEAGPNMHQNEEKDWYYNIEKENEKAERCGPVTFSEVRASRRQCDIHLAISCSQNSSFFALVEGAVESESNQSKNTLLGHRYGWMAIIAAVASIEMVFDG